jgi:hypothetical protein
LKGKRRKTENDMNGYNVREVLKVKDMKDDAPR